ncbi:energy-coupling factor transporter ATP-binding protein EcfA2 [Bradyrhizobium japonicum]
MAEPGKPTGVITGEADSGNPRTICVEGNVVGAALIVGDNNIVTIVYGDRAARPSTDGLERSSTYVRQIRIFLSSPGDVVHERQLAREVVKELVAEPFLRDSVTLTIVSWDDPDAPVPLLANLTPQEAIDQGRPTSAACDIVVVVLWSRIGTPLSDKFRKPDGSPYLSGTEWEYEQALNSPQRPDILIYRRTEKALLDADDPQLTARLDQKNRLKSFFGRLRNSDGSLRAGVTDYESPTTFYERLKKDLRERIANILSRPAADRSEFAASKTLVVQPWKAAPYPGLRSFVSAETEIFFGRGREVDAMLAALRKPARRFLAVVGASGSGKSSLVEAGLLPRLSEGVIEGSEHWPVFKLSPGAFGDNALMALASRLEVALPTHYRKQPTEIAKILAETPRQLSNYADALVVGRPRGTPIVLVVDQFEELFTVTSEVHRACFLRLLAECSDDPRVLVVATLRADFLPQCAAEPSLGAQLQEGTFVLGKPGPTALLDMIRKPAERAGLEFEDGLDEEILRDLGGDAGALPLMAFCLEELHRRTNVQHALTIQTYRDMGGVKGVLKRRIVELLEMLRKDADLSGVLPQMFRALVFVDEAGKAVRQRANLNELLAGPAPMPELVKMLVAPGRVLLAEDVAGRPTVMLAHEALLQQWPALSEWLESNRTDMQRVQRALSSLTSQESRDRRWAVETLAEVKPATQEVINILIGILEHPRTETRASAAEALGRIGPVSPAIVPALVAVLHSDEYPMVRGRVAQALGRIWLVSFDSVVQQVEQELVVALGDGDASVRQSVVEALGSIGPRAAAAIPALQNADRIEMNGVVSGMIHVALTRISREP